MGEVKNIQKKCYVRDSQNRVSTILYFDIKTDGEIYVKMNRRNRKNVVHISIHKSGIKHVKEDGNISHKWQKDYSASSMQIEHRHVMVRSEFHIPVTALPEDALVIDMPDNCSLVDIILVRLPKTIPPTQNWSMSSQDEHGNIIEEFQYKNLATIDEAENNNYRLCYRCVTHDSNNKKNFDKSISMLKQDIMNRVWEEKGNLESLKNQTVTELLEIDGAIFNPIFLDVYITEQDIKTYAESLQKPN